MPAAQLAQHFEITGRQVMARGSRKAAVNSETVRGEYSSGTGWKAGELAPSTKYVDMDGNVSDSEPKGGGSVLVAKGDVVRPHMVEAMKSGKQRVFGDLSNENSPGDAANRDVPQTDVATADDDADDDGE